MNTRVLNLYGGPGTGKSTTAAGVYYELKRRGYNVEMAREYAKDVVWEGRRHLLTDQIYIFAKQLKRITDLLGKVQLVITDSPVLFSLVYGASYPRAFHILVEDERSKMENIDILLTRVKPYESAGRVHNEKEAKVLDGTMKQMLDEEGITYHTVIANNDAVWDIVQKVLPDLVVDKMNEMNRI